MYYFFASFFFFYLNSLNVLLFPLFEEANGLALFLSDTLWWSLIFVSLSLILSYLPPSTLSKKQSDIGPDVGGGQNRACPIRLCL